MKILRSILPSKSNPRSSPTTLNYAGDTLTDPQQIAEALNAHYITIGAKTSEEIKHQQHQEDKHTDQTQQEEPRSCNTPSFALQHTTIKQVTDTMNSINRNKASDIYNIKPTIIRDLTPFLAPTLTALFNRSIDDNEYPDALKLTKLIEVYKSKDVTLPVNYRPISLLPIIAKILDTILNNQLMDHLTKHNLISPTQYAFRPNSSTTLALQTIINNIHQHKSKHKPTLAIYIDLSKAYDTISHAKLIHKLKHEFNFTDSTTAFFATYFQRREQSTHTQHAQSTMRTITHGIPQGSTLSTTFFLLYINNIIKTATKSTVYTYADDTTLIITADTVADLEAVAQSELNALITYFHNNNLVPNPTKTNYTIFHPPKAQIQLNISTTILEHNQHAKLLGIMIESTQKHHQTITNIIKKLQPVIHKLRHASNYLSTPRMKQLYYTHAYPHLIGDISIWGTDDSSKTYIQPLVRIQKKLIRIIKNLPPRTHTKPIMQELSILSLYNLYTLRVCAEMHPHIYPKANTNRPSHGHNYLWTAQIHDHQTRHSQQQHQYIPNPYQYSARIPHHSSDYLTQQYSKAWNGIPLEIRNNQSISSFKTELRLYLLAAQDC
jgi:hypothetical protein